MRLPDEPPDRYYRLAGENHQLHFGPRPAAGLSAARNPLSAAGLPALFCLRSTGNHVDTRNHLECLSPRGQEGRIMRITVFCILAAALCCGVDCTNLPWGQSGPPDTQVADNPATQPATDDQNTTTSDSETDGTGSGCYSGTFSAPTARTGRPAVRGTSPSRPMTPSSAGADSPCRPPSRPSR